MSIVWVVRSVKFGSKTGARLTVPAQWTGRTRLFYTSHAVESALKEIGLVYLLQAELEGIHARRVALASLGEAVENLDLED